METDQLIKETKTMSVEEIMDEKLGDKNKAQGKGSSDQSND